MAIGPLFFNAVTTKDLDGVTRTIYVLPGSSPAVLLIWFVLIIIPAGYGVDRPKPMEKYMKQGLEQAVFEFEGLKSMVIIVLPLIVIFGAAYMYSTPQLAFESLDTEHRGFKIYSYFGFIFYPLFSVTFGSLYMYLEIISKGEFRFYLSRGYFRSALNRNDIFEQMNNFGCGLQEYNSYLRRHLKHQIKDIDKIFSRMSLLDNDARTDIIRSLSDSFEAETERLKPLKYISSNLMKSEGIESVLIPRSLKSQLTVLGKFLAASIPILISIITLFMTITTPPHK